MQLLELSCCFLATSVLGDWPVYCCRFHLSGACEYVCIVVITILHHTSEAYHYTTNRILEILTVDSHDNNLNSDFCHFRSFSGFSNALANLCPRNYPFVFHFLGDTCCCLQQSKMLFWDDNWKICCQGHCGRSNLTKVICFKIQALEFRLH
jgi:hypothetical protein